MFFRKGIRRFSFRFVERCLDRCELGRWLRVRVFSEEVFRVFLIVVLLVCFLYFV